MEKNQEYINQINEIIEKFQKNFSHELHKSCNSHLIDYIMRWSAFLDDGCYKFRTRVWYTINGYSDFVECQHEKCHDKIHRDIVTLNNPCIDYCCSQCRYAASKFRNSISVNAKAISPERKALKARRIKLTKNERYGDENYNNHSRIVETVQRRYGQQYTNVFQVPSVIENIKKTNLDRYGESSYAKTRECKDKVINTSLKRYGVDKASKCDDIKEKAKQTCIERYGSENPIGNDKIYEKVKATCNRLYGCDHPMQNHQIRIKQQLRYEYEGKKFDSMPEIAIYIYCKDHNVNFTYQPMTCFKYKCNDKEKTYFPDFEIDGMLYEVKGLHFFMDKDPTKEMVNPYDHSQDDAYEAKHQCMIQNDVQILTEFQYQKYIDYVESRYGKGYLNQFKRRVNT